MYRGYLKLWEPRVFFLLFIFLWLRLQSNCSLWRILIWLDWNWSVFVFVEYAGNEIPSAVEWERNMQCAWILGESVYWCVLVWIREKSPWTFMNLCSQIKSARGVYLTELCLFFIFPFPWWIYVRGETECFENFWLNIWPYNVSFEKWSMGFEWVLRFRCFRSKRSGWEGFGIIRCLVKKIAGRGDFVTDCIFLLLYFVFSALFICLGITVYCLYFPSRSLSKESNMVRFSYPLLSFSWTKPNKGTSLLNWTRC